MLMTFRGCLTLVLMDLAGMVGSEDSVCVLVPGRCGCWLSWLERRGSVVSELFGGLDGGRGNVNVGRAVMGAGTLVRGEVN
jgi:hypothetical protein